MAKRTGQIRVPRDLGVVCVFKKIFLYFNLLANDGVHFRLGVSSNGLNFRTSTQNPAIINGRNHGDTAECSDFKITKVKNKYYLIYKSSKLPRIRIASSLDLITWKKMGSISNIKEVGMIVPDYKYKGQNVMYFGENEIKIAFSKDLKKWTLEKEPVLKPRGQYFDSFPLEMGSVRETASGILVIYYVKANKREGIHYLVGAALFDKNTPGKLIWRRDTTVWEQTKEYDGRKIYPLGAVVFNSSLFLYFGIEKEEVFVVLCPSFEEFLGLKKIFPSPVLKKVRNNPIIKPVLRHAWESQAAFNSASIFEDGKVHFIYRAIGDSGTSVLGYASSKDGINIDERLDEPIYTPKEKFELPGGVPLVSFMSGGGYGGCEDPRLTKIGDRIYMTYVAFNGWNHPRVALTSISTDDFRNKRWNWARSKIISPPGIVDKNACIFPEKINGKYVILHRIFPNILLDFVDDLEFNNFYLKGEFSIKPRESSWDSRKIGAGAPPIKTKDGWLLIYHAVDDRNASQYKIGAMILDKDNPTKVHFWSKNPILEPTEWYENQGYKAGVAYPCGAVVLNGQLFVYYGAADTVVCAAEENLDKFLKELKISSPVKPDPKPIPQRVFKYYD